MKEITVEAAIEQIETVTEFVNLILEDAECSVKTRMHIDIAIDELLSNIANYAERKKVPCFYWICGIIRPER